MSKYGSGHTFSDICRYERKVLKSALNNKRRKYNGERWVEEPCTKEEAEEIILNVYDELAYQAKDFSRSARALEIIMENHGLKLGRDYSLQEYMAVVEDLKQKDQDVPIFVVK